MGQHAGTVDPLPDERAARRLVELVPGKFLGQEEADARAPHDLGQRARVAKDVRVPEFAANPPELLLEETLAREELAHERLAAGDIAIGLDPGAAREDELPLLDLGLDLCVKRGLVFPDPGQLLGLGAGELVLGIIVHHPHGGREGAIAFAPGFRQRPEPGRVDVGVADGRDVMIAVAVAGGEELLRDGAARRVGRGVAEGDGVGDGVGGGQRVALIRTLCRELLRQFLDDDEIPEKVPHRTVADDQPRLAQVAEGLPLGRADAAAVAQAEHPVDRRLDMESPLFAALRLRHQGEMGADVLRSPVVARQPLDRDAILPDASFRSGIEVEQHLFAAPFLWDRVIDAEPMG